MTTTVPRRVSVRYDVPVVRDDWTLPEEPMPEASRPKMGVVPWPRG